MQNSIDYGGPALGMAVSAGVAAVGSVAATISSMRSPISNSPMNIYERFILICKPEQSGKTFVMLQKIIKDMNYPIDKDIINIIFCDNNLLLTRQTCTRVASEIPKVEINGEIYLEFSSHTRTTFNTADAVKGAIAVDGIKNILCCTNGTRVDDIYEIIDKINKSQHLSDKFYFKIWLDEADKYINYIDQCFKPLIEEYDNISLYGITATAKNLFNRYGALNVFPLENTTIPTYHGWNDNNIKIIDSNRKTIEFIDDVLKFRKGLIQPGTKWFIPADSRKSTHIEAMKLCRNNYGMATIIINGDGIILHMPNLEQYKYKKDEELNKILLKIYREHELHKYPLSITGYLCIGRGISISSHDFMFDYGILSNTRNPNEASQNAGRLKGNMKNWPNYKPPIVFTTEKFDKIAREWEIKSRGLAELAFRRDLEGKSTIITKNEFKTVGEDYEYVLHEDLFKSYADAIKFLKGIAKKYMKTKVSGSKGGAIHKSSGGYEVSTKLNTKAEITDDDRLDINKSLTIGNGNSISSTEKGSRYLILPVYETMESQPKDVLYQVRYIKFTS
uniref:Uncharacterized protein n=1 Tax=viral metagenome TaxID=1070528 RepID=A0A6C0C4Z6_9ZZZZ